MKRAQLLARVAGTTTDTAPPPGRWWTVPLPPDPPAERWAEYWAALCGGERCGARNWDGQRCERFAGHPGDHHGPWMVGYDGQLARASWGIITAGENSPDDDGPADQ